MARREKSPAEGLFSFWRWGLAGSRQRLVAPANMLTLPAITARMFYEIAR